MQVLEQEQEQEQVLEQEQLQQQLQQKRTALASCLGFPLSRLRERGRGEGSFPLHPKSIATDSWHQQFHNTL
ncbi:hypothetical protein VC279_15460 [Xanthomonas sp. WHRI 10064A]|uniref:hypothetical protein n=1 Tax=unclassified Xanthomonas TaxID=2643310 RepID=UPI002B232876|nr:MULTISPECIES: hypothetical protein [unclassified Xanthomonas]MEA9586862.1 hypothetical protein [Xanthomonas sp. WHRI 10064B]MEA9616053.1 hypothetical protein [Xanthomonas sp. WHRI 10064A]